MKVSFTILTMVTLHGFRPPTSKQPVAAEYYCNRYKAYNNLLIFLKDMKVIGDQCYNGGQLLGVHMMTDLLAI